MHNLDIVIRILNGIFKHFRLKNGNLHDMNNVSFIEDFEMSSYVSDGNISRYFGQISGEDAFCYHIGPIIIIEKFSDELFYIGPRNQLLEQMLYLKLYYA